jgi:hypothetical protein
MLDAPKSTVNDLSPLMLQAYRQSQDVKLFCDVESRKTSGAEVLPDEVGFPAHPWRVRPRFQPQPAARHPAEDFLHGLRCGRHFLFQNHFSRFI